MKYDSENFWSCGEQKLSTPEVFESIKDYVGKGGTIFVGTDSMLKHDYCKFASVIAIKASLDIKPPSLAYSKTSF